MNPLEKLKSEYSSYKGPDDIVKAILFKTSETTIPKDPSIIHKVFFQLKETREYHDLLNEFSFDLSGLSPFSELLDRVLFRLEISCILKTPNPSYEKYTINSSDKTFEKSFNKFGEEEKKIISEISQTFSSLIN